MATILRSFVKYMLWFIAPVVVLIGGAHLVELILATVSMVLGDWAVPYAIYGLFAAAAAAYAAVTYR